MLKFCIVSAVAKPSGWNLQLLRWPGSEAQWKVLSDITDARVLAKHLLWAATTKAAHNEAFNVVNGDYFRCNLWPKLASFFGIEWIGYEGEIKPLEAELAKYESAWTDLANKYKLAEPNLHQLASAWHTDLDLGRPMEVMTDMS